MAIGEGHTSSSDMYGISNIILSRVNEKEKTLHFNWINMNDNDNDRITYCGFIIKDEHITEIKTNGYVIIEINFYRLTVNGLSKFMENQEIKIKNIYYRNKLN